MPEESLAASAAPKTRNVRDLLARIHNVRLMWLKGAAPELLAGLEKIETKKLSGKKQLANALAASGAAIEGLLRKAIADGGKVKGFKPHVVALLGYLISHEAHHRGQLAWALKPSGQRLNQKVSFGLWEWGVR